MVKKLLLIGCGIVTIVSLAGAIYFYTQYQKAQAVLTTPTMKAQQEAEKTLKNVGALMDLPTDEQPTIATISDISKLKDQPFFAKAKNGDKILIYTKSQKAILYDPVTNRIVDFAPVNIGPTAPSGTPVEPSTKVKAKATPTPKVTNTP